MVRYRLHPIIKYHDSVITAFEVDADETDNLSQAGVNVLVKVTGYDLWTGTTGGGLNHYPTMIEQLVEPWSI